MGATRNKQRSFVGETEGKRRLDCQVVDERKILKSILKEYVVSVRSGHILLGTWFNWGTVWSQ